MRDVRRTSKETYIVNLYNIQCSEICIYLRPDKVTHTELFIYFPFFFILNFSFVHYFPGTHMLERQREFRELRAMRREEAVSTKWYNDFRAEEGRERRGRWGMAEAEGEMRSFLWDEAEKLRLQVCYVLIGCL